jgi:hypothetical protein
MKSIRYRINLFQLLKLYSFTLAEWKNQLFLLEKKVIIWKKWSKKELTRLNKIFNIYQ